MILVDLPAGQPLYRAHTPKWASQALSGAGAAMQGGRFNRPGIPALHLSLEIETAAALFDWSSRNKASLQEKVRYGKDDLVVWHPVTGSRLGDGMTLEDLAAAAVTHSDNPATNLIMRRIGGPDAVTRYARSIGNMSLRVDSWEPRMNSNPEAPGTSRPRRTWP